MFQLEYDITAIPVGDYVVFKDERGDRYRISGMLLQLLAHSAMRPNADAAGMGPKTER